MDNLTAGVIGALVGVSLQPLVLWAYSWFPTQEQLRILSLFVQEEAKCNSLSWVAFYSSKTGCQTTGFYTFPKDLTERDIGKYLLPGTAFQDYHVVMDLERKGLIGFMPGIEGLEGRLLHVRPQGKRRLCLWRIIATVGQ